MSENHVINAIEATLVADDDRLSFLPKHLGKLMMRFESLVYSWMSRLSDDYTGGYWNFYDLSNGGFYLAPSDDKKFQVSSPNSSQGDVSADAAGIIATLFAINSIIGEIAFDQKKDPPDNLVDEYYLLRDYAAEHAESRKIFEIID
jgi:Antirestriction protein